MKPRMWKLLLILSLVLMAGMVMVSPVLAATSQNVNVGATPNYIAISNTPTTWLLNGITGAGRVYPNTVYYANPAGDTTAPAATVADGSCRFTLTNTSGPAIDLYVTSGNFTGGDANMTNSNLGSNGATSYGGYSWYSGMTYTNKVIMKDIGSSILDNEFSGASLKWGAEIKTRTNAFTGATTSNTTMTISAVVD